MAHTLYKIPSMNHEQTMRRMNNINARLIKVKNEAFAELQNLFRSKTVQEVKKIISISSSKVLTLLMEISLPAEDYRICEAVKQITDERKNGFTLLTSSLV